MLAEAGLQLLADGHAAATLTAGVVAAQAGLDTAAIDTVFGNLTGLLTELMQRLLDQTRQQASAATDDLPSGIARLKRGVQVYLDEGLRLPQLRELILLLQHDAAAARLYRNRARGWIMIFQVDLASAGVARSQEVAQIVTSMAVEIALAEFETRQRQQQLRHTLGDYFDHLQP